MQKKDYLRMGAIASILLCLLLVGCGPSAEEQAATSEALTVAAATDTPNPTYTPMPTYTPYPTYTPLPPSPTPLPTNIALNKPVVITLSDGWDNTNGVGDSPDDVTDGSIEYIGASQGREDGCVGYVNNDYGQTSNAVITIDLEGLYVITKIRYNMGNVQKANTWGADKMITPFGESTVTPGISYTGSIYGAGAWTEITGNIIASEVTITFEKTRTSRITDWLFIGEIEIYGIPANSP